VIECEIRIASAQDHIFMYELIIYGHGSQIFHVTSLECMAEQRSCNSFAREAMITFAQLLGIEEKELKWIASK
jgi:hypothetical protein